MAFWEELGKTITDKGKEATKRAKELTEVIQLKSQLSAEKTKIQEAYAAIGKLYYEENKDCQDEKFQEAFSWVNESLERSNEIEEQISQLEGNRVCAECGCKVAKEDLYCRRCGAPMASAKDEYETADEEESSDKEDSAAEEETDEEAPVFIVEEDTREEAVESILVEAAEEIPEEESKEL